MIDFHIVLPIHNRIEKTRACLRSLSRQSHKRFHLWLVDDGSTDSTHREIPAEFNGLFPLTLIRGDGNLWWGGSVHWGLEQILSSAGINDYAILMNNDVTFQDDFLERAARATQDTPGAIICPLVVDDRDKVTLCKSGAANVCWALSLVHRPYEGRKLAERGTFEKLTSIDFMRAQATIIPLAVVRIIGNVAAKELPQYHSDSEYAWRARRRGISVYIHRDLEVFHSVDSTGAFNVFKKGFTFGDFFRSLYDIRSPNCLKYKCRFAKLCCPRWLIPVFMISDTCKITARSILTILMGGRIVDIRNRINQLLAREKQR